MNGMAASDKIFCLLDLPEPEKGTKESGGSSLDVDFENVSFSYEEDRQILKEISFRICRVYGFSGRRIRMRKKYGCSGADGKKQGLSGECAPGRGGAF